MAICQINKHNWLYTSINHIFIYVFYFLLVARCSFGIILLFVTLYYVWWEYVVANVSATHTPIFLQLK